MFSRLNDNLLELGKTVFNNLEQNIHKESLYNQVNIQFGAPYKSKKFNEERKGLPLIRIRDLKTGLPQFYTEENTGKDIIVNSGDLIIGMDAEFKPTIWQGKKSLLNQRVMKVEVKNGISPLYYYYVLTPKMNFFEKSKSGTTVIHLGKRDLDTITVPIIKNKAFINRIFNPIWLKLTNNYTENRKLLNLKNILLNKYF